MPRILEVDHPMNRDADGRRVCRICKRAEPVPEWGLCYPCAVIKANWRAVLAELGGIQPAGVRAEILAEIRRTAGVA